jgi:hypothetical protein
MALMAFMAASRTGAAEEPIFHRCTVRHVANSHAGARRLQANGKDWLVYELALSYDRRSYVECPGRAAFGSESGPTP